MRSNGIILIAAGFLAAVLGGLFLAVQVANGQAGGSVLFTAILIFVPVAGLVVYGIYLYTRSQNTDLIVPNAEMLKPRELWDTLKGQEVVEVHQAAATLNVMPDEVIGMMRQLVALEVFSGYVNWEDNLLCALEPDQLRILRVCAQCQMPIDLNGQKKIVCKACRTEYYLP